MKIAFIFGKGIEGCGVTKGATIFEEWLVKQGHETMVIDFDNKQKFGRAKDAVFLGPILRVESHQSINDVPEIVAAVNGCDIAIVHSYPTSKNTDYIDRFREFVSRIHDPIIVVHDHAITVNTINRQTQAGELFTMADIGVVQSFEGYSRDGYTAADPGLSEYIVENPIWIQTPFYDKYRKSFEERRKHFLYMGRMSTLKDPGMIPRIEPYLKNEWELSLIGCERSISSIGDPDATDLSIEAAPYHKIYQPKIRFVGTNSEGEHYLPGKEKEKTGTTITAYDSYKYDFGMGELGSSMAAWCGYRLGEVKEYGHRMEYTVIESFLLSLPVISRHFAENASSPEGKKWGEYFGPLVSEARREAELADELRRIASNKEEWIERTRACQQLIHKFNDVNIIAPKFLDFVLTKGKRPNKVNYIESISSYFPSAAERRARGEIIVSTATSCLKKKPYVLVNGRQTEVNEPKKTGSTLEVFF